MADSHESSNSSPQGISASSSDVDGSGNMIDWSAAVDLNLFVSSDSTATTSLSKTPSPASNHQFPHISNIDHDAQHSVSAPVARLGHWTDRKFNFDSTGDEESCPSIIYSQLDGSLEMATLEKIIERITINPEPVLASILVMTHPVFCSGEELMDALIQRFHNCSPADQKVVHSRTLVFMRDWLEKCRKELHDDNRLMDYFGEFLKWLRETGNHSSSEFVSLNRAYHSAISQLMTQETPCTIVWGSAPPQPIIPIGTPNILNVDPFELARQITLLDQDFFHRISLRECLRGSFSDSDLVIRSPNLFVYLNWTRKFANWVSSQICLQESLRTRVKAFTCFVECASHLKAINNFNGLFAVVTGLLAPPVIRLKRTTGALHSKLSSTYVQLLNIAKPDKNFEILRNLQDNAVKPCIPSIQLILKDLEAAEPQTQSSTELLNIRKLKMLSATIKTIQDHQTIKYSWIPVPTMQQMIMYPSGFNESTLLTISTWIEPPAGRIRGEKPVQLMNEEELKRLQEEAECFHTSPDGTGSPKNAEWSVSLGRDGLEYEVIFIPNYRFYSRDTSYNIRVEIEDGIALIQAAVVEKLVEHMTPARKAPQDDPHLMSTFFSTFRGFTTSGIVLDLLMMRYQPPALKSQDKLQLQAFQQHYELPIKTRICTALHYWLENHIYDFSNSVLREKLRDFLMGKVMATQPRWAKLLLRELETQLIASSQRIGGALSQKAIIASSPSTDTISYSILDFDITHLAQQLVMVTHNYWTRIRLNEFMNRGWIGPQAHGTSPNVLAFLGLLDKLTYNLEMELSNFLRLTGTKKDQLHLVISSWLQIAKKCQEYLCWPVAEAIVSVIHFCYTKELTAIWEKVPAPVLQYFYSSRSLFDNRDQYLTAVLNSFSKIQLKKDVPKEIVNGPPKPIDNANEDSQQSPKPTQISPIIPTKGRSGSLTFNSGGISGVPPLKIMLEDIVQIEDEFPSLVLEMGPRVINFAKYRRIGEIFQPIMLTQKSSYQWQHDHKARSWLLREPKPNEIPSERFASRFSNRSSIHWENTSSNPHNPNRVSDLQKGLSSEDGTKGAVDQINSPITPSKQSLSSSDPQSPELRSLAVRTSKYHIKSGVVMARSLTFSAPQSEHKPSTKETPNPVQITPQHLVELFKFHPSLIRDLIEEALEDAKFEISTSSEVQALLTERQLAKKHLEAMNFLRAERKTTTGKKAQIKRCMTNYRQGVVMSTFKHLDTSGEVFGFVHPVILEVASQGNHRILCEIAENADIPDIALLYKSGNLYKLLNPTLTVECVLLHDETSPKANKFAEKCGVLLLKVDPYLKIEVPISMTRRNTLAPRNGLMNGPKKPLITPSYSASSVPSSRN